jgi:hypothetical protein
MWQPGRDLQALPVHPLMLIRVTPDSAQLFTITEHAFKSSKGGMREKVAMLATLTTLLTPPASRLNEHQFTTFLSPSPKSARRQAWAPLIRMSSKPSSE